MNSHLTCLGNNALKLGSRRFQGWWRGIIICLLALAVAVLSLGILPATSHPEGKSRAYITAENKLPVADELAIRQIMARANHAVDTADYDLYLSFFLLTTFMDSGFGPPLRAHRTPGSSEQSRPLISGKRHVTANIVMHGEGDRAEVVSYLIVFERDAAVRFAGSAVITDTFEKRNDKWVIVRHVTRMDPATIAALQALQQR